MLTVEEVRKERNNYVCWSLSLGLPLFASAVVDLSLIVFDLTDGMLSIRQMLL